MVRDHPHCIFKTLTAPKSSFAETRRLDERSISRLDTLRTAPAIFQTEVLGARDLRITIVGTDVFASVVKRNNPTANTIPDWRLDTSATCEVFHLPDAIAHKLLLHMNMLGLTYGAIDMLLDDQGQYWFLEVNPSGQFLFVEIDTGQQISTALARLLTDSI